MSDWSSATLFRVTAGGVVTAIASDPPFSQPTGVTQDASTGDFIVIDNLNDTLFRIRPPVSADCNTNGIPDECDTLGDFDGDGVFSTDDLTGFTDNLLVPDCTILGDFDGNGLSDGLDIQLAVDCLISGICP